MDYIHANKTVEKGLFRLEINKKLNTFVEKYQLVVVGWTVVSTFNF